VVFSSFQVSFLFNCILYLLVSFLGVLSPLVPSFNSPSFYSRLYVFPSVLFCHSQLKAIPSNISFSMKWLTLKSHLALEVLPLQHLHTPLESIREQSVHCSWYRAYGSLTLGHQPLSTHFSARSGQSHRVAYVLADFSQKKSTVSIDEYCRLGWHHVFG
jgi:hypothetical protein